MNHSWKGLKQMLTIVTQNGTEFNWTLGEKSFTDQIIMERIVEVRANGDELKFIVDQFVNVKYRKGINAMSFFGDDAKAIAGNLPDTAGIDNIVPVNGFSANAVADLKKMMKNPSYWRDQDPAIVKEVRSMFRSLYGHG